MPFGSEKFRSIRTSRLIKQGSRVKSIEGGPEMVVSSFSDDKKVAYCVWWDEAACRIRQNWIPADSLKTV